MPLLSHLDDKYFNLAKVLDIDYDYNPDVDVLLEDASFFLI